jgi:hypothetical protein
MRFVHSIFHNKGPDQYPLLFRTKSYTVRVVCKDLMEQMPVGGHPYNLTRGGRIEAFVCQSAESHSLAWNIMSTKSLARLCPHMAIYSGAQRERQENHHFPRV